MFVRAVVLLVVCLLHSRAHAQGKLPYPIGVFLRVGSDPDVNQMLNFVRLRHHARINHTNFIVEILQGTINSPSTDMYGVWSTVCQTMQPGMFVMVGEADVYSTTAYDSLARHMHMPFINWSLSPKHKSLSEFTVSVRPPTDQLLAEWILMKNWTSITFMHDGDDGVSNLERVHEHLRRLRPGFICLTQVVQLPANVLEFSDFLYEFHRARYNMTIQHFHVIVHVSNRFRQKKFMSALEQVSLQSPDRFHYVMGDYGLTNADIDMMRERFLNFTAFQVCPRHMGTFQSFEQDFLAFKTKYQHRDREHKHVILDDIGGEEEKDEELSIEAALLHDAMQVAVNAIAQAVIAQQQRDALSDTPHTPGGIRSVYHRGHFTNYQMPGLFCVPSEYEANRKHQHRPFQWGPHIMHYMKLTDLGDRYTLTGPIQFNEDGIRVNFAVHVFDLTYPTGSSMPIEQRYTWNDTEGFTYHSSGQVSDRSNPFNKTVRITTVLGEPFVRWHTHDNGTESLEGYCIDLINLLAKNMGFKYNISIVKDGKYGNVNEDGTWNGMIGELLRDEADFAVAPLTISRTRERVVDFSKPFITTGISIMIKKPDKQDFSVFSFMQPLSMNIWVLIILAQIGVSFVLFLVSRFSPYEWRVDELSNGSFMITNDFSIYNCLWFTLAAFMQQGTDILPRSVSGRIASAAWWFFTMIMIASYTANLAAFLTSEKLTAGIDSVEQLAKQTKIKYGIQSGGSTAAFFQGSSVPIYKRMWHYMNSQVPEVLVSSYDEGIARVRDGKGQYAFLLEATANEYQNNRKPCNTMKVGDLLNSVGYGVATPFGSPYRQSLNLAILALQELGELKKLENKWWYDRGQCEKTSSDGQSSSLNLSKVAGIFYILIGGMIISMTTALCELIYRARGEITYQDMAPAALSAQQYQLLHKQVGAVGMAHFGSELVALQRPRPDGLCGSDAKVAPLQPWHLPNKHNTQV